ncbi:MAG TPA: ATP-binding protein [Gammaproteobacteria bacterium]|jgi:two-component system sensor histidine kinase RegB|nr:ATP-binding protein [Gammaproteobacteria bacterium]
MSQSVEAGLPLREQTGPQDALRLLYWLRIVAIATQTLLVLIVHFGLDSPLPLPEIGLAIGALALWNVLNTRAVHTPRTVEHGEVALNLIVDVVAFSAVLYFTGGSTNPFVSLYLVPISLAAISLPAVQAWLVAFVCAAGYSFLWWRHVPLPAVHTRLGGAFDLHLAGMWVNFVIAAALIVLFVGRLARLVRQRDREVAALREAALRNRQIVELGALAAGTAHELNTPLSTLAILVEELDDAATDPAQKRQLRAMMDELATVNERLNRIAGRAGAERSAGARQVGLREFVTELLAQWARTQPGIELAATFEWPEEDVRIVAEATIEQAIRNVLDNAAHATLANGGRVVAAKVRAHAGAIEIAVTDQGAGLDPAVRDGIGVKVVSTKPRGLGMGLLLSRAALQRFGGRLDLASGAGGGVEARIELPLAELTADVR